MNHEETKYTVGDVFIRNYNGVDWLCILTSRDFEKEPHNRMVWQSTMLMMFDSGLGGGKSTEYYEEDLDGLIQVGRVSVHKERTQHSVHPTGGRRGENWTVGFTPCR